MAHCFPVGIESCHDYSLWQAFVLRNFDLDMYRQQALAVDSQVVVHVINMLAFFV